MKSTTMPDDCVRDAIDSPVGRLTLVASSRGLHFLGWDGAAWDALPVRPRHEVLREAKKQLAEYFARKRRVFDLPLVLDGTDFQLRAWRELLRIPYGQTISYDEQARRVGDRNKARAVGMANGQNRIAIVIPCHRVIAKSGALAGFGGGVPNKRRLLDLEGAGAQLTLGGLHR